ncbi:MAG: glycosyltransferase family 2 protein [Candidatus Omnitrophota bacterium]
MKFHYSRQGLNKKEMFLQRFFEVLPGLTSWALLLGVVTLSVWAPLVAAIAVIAFMLAWILRLFYLTIFLLFSYVRLSVEKNTDWLARIRGMDRFEAYLEEMRGTPRGNGLYERASQWLHSKDMRRLKKSGNLPPCSSEIFHLVVIPVVKESPEVVEANVLSVVHNGVFPKQTVMVLAVEARAERSIRDGMAQLAGKHRDQFMEFLLVEHPDGVPGEARVKGANTSHAARAAAKYFEDRKIPFENVIVSCFDADTVVVPNYFACLTYCFMNCPDRHRASFQPVPVFHNNIWEVPGFARVVETGSSFFQLIETTDPERLVTFSSHSMSFKALVEVGYWPADMISEDSGIFWKSYLHFDGRYQVVPIPTTLSMDIVDAGSWWGTVASLYKQKRRWAWGAENFPLVMRGFLGNKKIPFHDKLQHGFKLFEGQITWSTLPFLLTFVGWLPVISSGNEFANTVLYYNAGRFTQAIFGLSTVALVSTIMMSLWLLPKKKKRFPLFWTLIHGLEWFLVPFILVFLSAMPALDAQTRLMLNRRMEFWVSDKRRNLNP